MSTWYIKHPELYTSIEKELRNYSSLHLFNDKGKIYIRGTLFIHLDGKELDNFQIEIEFPDNFPEDIPFVRETGGRLEKIADRHFYGGGVACLFLKDESYKHYKPEMGIANFIEKCVKNFFIWQIDYDLHAGKPTMKARSHNTDGALEFYKEELGVENISSIITFLEYHVSDKIKGHWPCYCGSGKELRRCHIEKQRDLKKKIVKKYAKNTLDALKNLSPK